jgi:hypothetical protein
MKKVKVIQPFYEKLNAELYVDDERCEELKAKGLVKEVKEEVMNLYADGKVIATSSIKGNGKRKVLPKQSVEKR